MRTFIVAFVIWMGCLPCKGLSGDLRIERDVDLGTICVFRKEESDPILTQHSRPDFRPYLDPIAAPDGKGVITEYSPGHHKHQTGLYWGFTRVNGRDYFHHPDDGYWKRVSFEVLEKSGKAVSWRTIYDLIDESGEPVITEEQTWEMRDQGDEFLLDLIWKGTARKEVTIGEWKYGGLFLRMPWRKGIKGEVINANGERNQGAEGKRSNWVDVGMQVEGRKDFAHVAIFDHPENGGFPQPWRVDRQLGVGPSRARLGDWTIRKGEAEVIRHRFVIYTGEFDERELNEKWRGYTGNRDVSVEAAAIQKTMPRSRYSAFDARLVDREASRLFFEKQRARQMVKLDSAETLSLLVKTLSQTSNPLAQEGVLRGIVRGLEGRRSVAKPDGWSEVSSKLRNSSSGEILSMVRQLDQVFGDRAAAERAIARLRDAKAPIEERQVLLRTLVTQQNQQLLEILPHLLDEEPMRIPAIRAYGVIEDEAAPATLLSRYSGWDGSTRRAVVETLAMRKQYASAMLEALKAGKLAKADIPAHVARPMSSLLGDSFTDVFGNLHELSKDKEELMARYTKLLTDANLSKADASKGRLVFSAACSACHQIYGEGGLLGPDLTGSNRADLSYILLNMIEPSADIPEAYQLVTLHTKDGQLLGGTIKQEDDQRVVLNMVGQTTTVLKSDIAKREVSPLSMMPEGLLLTLQDSQVLDLVKYLQTTQQVDLPK